MMQNYSRFEIITNILVYLTQFKWDHKINHFEKLLDVVSMGFMSYNILYLVKVILETKLSKETDD